MKNPDYYRIKSVMLKTRVRLLLTSGFLIALLLQYTLIPTVMSYILLSVFYVIFFLIFAISDNHIEFRKPYVLLLGLFILVVYVRVLFDPNVKNIVRLGALMIFTIANIFILTSIVPFKDFLHTVNRFSAAIVVVGFFPYLGIPVQFSFVDLSLWSAEIYWHSGLQPITSIFPNPNQFGSLALVGSIAALYQYQRYGSMITGMFLAINLIGLVMSNYRTGWVILLSSFLLYAMYLMGRRKLFVLSVAGGLSTTIIFMLMVLGLVPGPSVVSETSLNGRRLRWIANFDALSEQPLWGYGFEGVTELDGTASNPHNSYIRMLTAFGVFGGILYLLLVAGTTVGSARQLRTDQDATLAVFLAGFFILQVFNQLSFVGISMRSTFIAIMVGYYITGASNIINDSHDEESRWSTYRDLG